MVWMVLFGCDCSDNVSKKKRMLLHPLLLSLCQAVSYFVGYLMAACAAARRAIGTRNGEQLT